MNSEDLFFCGFTRSLGYPDTEQEFAALGRTLGNRACRIPDSETGTTHKWITWQRELFEKSAQFEVAANYTDRDGTQFEMFRPTAAPADLKLPLEYASRACESFATFRRYRDQGRLPPRSRFQVSLPTPTAIVTTFVDREHRSAVAPALRQAMAREVREIFARIPEHDLAIQWDVAVELIGFEGGSEPPRYPLHIEVQDIFVESADEIAALSNPIPSAVQLGLHLCYGSANEKKYMHRAVEPTSLKASVMFSNQVLDRCVRRVEFLHMLSPSDRLDDAWFLPLADLTKGPEIILGVVHLCDGVPGAVARAFAARKYLGANQRLGIATGCGMGGLVEYGPEHMDSLLEMHAAVVDCLNLITGRLSAISPDTRIRKCIDRVVQVAHEVIQELRPSREEWHKFMDFLKLTADCCTETRNEFIMLFDFLGVRPLLDEIEVASWPTDATPPSAVGPFRSRGVPKYPAHGGDLCLSRSQPGLACNYQFKAISCGDERAVAGAEFEVWMANHEGVYSVRDPAAPKHNLYGEFLADDSGTISFRALKPKNYGVNTTGTGGAMLRLWGKSPIRPGHVHVAISAPGFETLVTALFFDDDPYLWADPAWGVSRPLVITAQKSDAGDLTAEFTFVMRPSATGGALEPPSKSPKTFEDKASCKRRITFDVLQSLKSCSDLRTQQVLEVLVRKLHSLAEELGLSVREYGEILRCFWAFRTASKSEFDWLFENHGCLALMGL